MAVEDVIKEVKQLAGVLRTVSAIPGFSALAIEADVLESWTQGDSPIIRQIYNAVETGTTMISAIVTALKEQGLSNAVSWLMSMGGKLYPH